MTSMPLTRRSFARLLPSRPWRAGVFGGKGKPFLPPLPDLESCEFARDFERLPEGVKPMVATFIEGLADYERRKKIADYKPKLDDRA